MFFVFDASTLFRPRWPTWGPKWAILRPKTGPRRAQDGFKTASRWHRKRASKTSSSWVAFWDNLGPKMGPSWGPRRAQEGPRGHQKSLQLRFNFVSGLGFDFGPTWGPKWANLGPKMGQLGPQNQLILKSKNAFRIVIYNIFCVFAMFRHEEYQHGESAKML